MILVKIELHSARTGKVTELGRMQLSNTGESGNPKRGDYNIELMRKGTTNKVQRRGLVRDYPRLSYTVWELVRRALECTLGKWPIHPGHPEEFDEQVKELNDLREAEKGFYVGYTIQPGVVSPEFQDKVDVLRGK